MTLRHCLPLAIAISCINAYGETDDTFTYLISDQILTTETNLESPLMDSDPSSPEKLYSSNANNMLLGIEYRSEEPNNRVLTMSFMGTVYRIDDDSETSESYQGVPSTSFESNVSESSSSLGNISYGYDFNPRTVRDVEVYGDLLYVSSNLKTTGFTLTEDVGGLHPAVVLGDKYDDDLYFTSTDETWLGLGAGIKVSHDIGNFLYFNADVAYYPVASYESEIIDYQTSASASAVREIDGYGSGFRGDIELGYKKRELNISGYYRFTGFSVDDGDVQTVFSDDTSVKSSLIKSDLSSHEIGVKFEYYLY